jgi:hypothetical protein
VGYGDVTPQSAKEKLIAIPLMLIGVVLVGFITSFVSRRPRSLPARPGSGAPAFASGAVLSHGVPAAPGAIVTPRCPPPAPPRQVSSIVAVKNATQARSMAKKQMVTDFIKDRWAGSSEGGFPCDWGPPAD